MDLKAGVRKLTAEEYTTLQLRLGYRNVNGLATIVTKNSKIEFAHAGRGMNGSSGWLKPSISFYS